MTTDHAPLAARLLTYMLGGKTDQSKLRRDYAKVLDRQISKSSLPELVSAVLFPKRD